MDSLGDCCASPARRSWLLPAAGLLAACLAVGPVAINAGGQTTQTAQTAPSTQTAPITPTKIHSAKSRAASKKQSGADTPKQ